MLKNYLMTAWKVFHRRKFMTFINLFGICITLVVIIVAVRVADNHLHPVGPAVNNENYLLISALTVTTEDGRNMSSSYPGYKFIKDYVLTLHAPEMISTYTKASQTFFFHNNEKIEQSIRRTDANYWKILQFEFIDGQAFDQSQFENGQSVAVVSQRAAEALFKKTNVVGQFIEVENQRFEIIGIVNNVPRTELESHADIWVPFTTLPTSTYRSEMIGNFQAMLYHSNPALLKDAKSEFVNQLKYNFVAFDIGDFKLTKAYSHADSRLEAMARDFFGIKTSYDDYLGKLMITITLLTLLFMFLPSINMVNLNLSRMMERASEIGVRKAYGASTGQLVWQFVVENVLLTLTGGLLALLLTSLIFYTVENSGLVPYVKFDLNFNVFLLSLMMIIIFSLVSGVYPAYKMACMDPVIALKGGA